MSLVRGIATSVVDLLVFAGTVHAQGAAERIEEASFIPIRGIEQ